jgi:uncharacterized protein
MKILIDIGHPAHVHLFKHFAWIMQEKGHEIFFTCREKEFEIDLLEHYGFNYTLFGKKYISIFGKLWGLFEYDIKELLQGLKIKPDLFISHGSIYAAHAAWLLGKSHISLEDTGNWEQTRMYLPFTEVVVTPDVLINDYGEKHIRYSGYHELAYLHPNQYNDNEIINNNILFTNKERYAIIRFSSWDATHDIGHYGLKYQQKINMISYLMNHLKVYISSESSLPHELLEYKIDIPPYQIHNVLANATIVISEGATIASESSLLGTPTIFVNSKNQCYIEDQSKYGLVYNLRNDKLVIDMIRDLLSIDNIKSEWNRRRNNMLADKIDVTSFLVWFIENYPHSYKVMKNNPGYQCKFK